MFSPPLARWTVPDERARRLPRLLGMVPGVAGVVRLQLLPLFFITGWKWKTDCCLVCQHFPPQLAENVPWTKPNPPCGSFNERHLAGKQTFPSLAGAHNSWQCGPRTIINIKRYKMCPRLTLPVTSCIVFICTLSACRFRFCKIKKTMYFKLTIKLHTLRTIKKN